MADLTSVTVKTVCHWQLRVVVLKSMKLTSLLLSETFESRLLDSSLMILKPAMEMVCGWKTLCIEKKRSLFLFLVTLSFHICSCSLQSRHQRFKNCSYCSWSSIGRVGDHCLDCLYHWTIEKSQTEFLWSLVLVRPCPQSVMHINNVFTITLVLLHFVWFFSLNNYM